MSAGEKKLRIASVPEQHTVESVLADSLQIIGNEVRKLKDASKRTTDTDLGNTKALSLCVDLVLRLRREQREETMGQRLEEMSDDSLNALLEEAGYAAARKKAAK